MSDSLRETIVAARAAGLKLAALDAKARSALLMDLGAAYADPETQKIIVAANEKDMAAANEAHARGELAAPLLKRLSLDEKKLHALVDGLQQMARAPELVGRMTAHRALDEGLILKRITCPLGVLGVVFEARPDALVQITGLALKSGNAAILKGGKEALNTNRALAATAHEVLKKHGIDTRAVVLIEDRAGVAEVLQQDDMVDIMIARGSAAFIHYVRANTKIPVMAHADGICHIFLHEGADADKAARIAVDAKTSYPAACNTVETLLWQPGAESALQAATEALLDAKVEVRVCAKTKVALGDTGSSCVDATEEDWSTEYGAPVISIRRVNDIDGALAHIARYGSRHTDVILTEDKAAAARFLAEVDTACCFHNASTRFSDGYRFGLGAEVGISTDKLHARGPVGVEGLLTYRWLLSGDGHVSTDYGDGPGQRRYLHKEL